MPENRRSLLSDIPEAVVQSARTMARNEGETLVGYKAITQSGPTCNAGCLAPGSSPHSHSTPVRWIVITDRGYYEVDPDGTFQRAAVLHRFPEEV